MQSRPSRVNPGEGGHCHSPLGCSGSATLELFGYGWRAERKSKEFFFQRKSQGLGILVVARGLLLAQPDTCPEWDTLSLCHPPAAVSLLEPEWVGCCQLCRAILILAGAPWPGLAFRSQGHVSGSQCVGFLSRWLALVGHRHSRRSWCR